MVVDGAEFLLVPFACPEKLAASTLPFAISKFSLSACVKVTSVFCFQCFEVAFAKTIHTLGINCGHFLKRKKVFNLVDRCPSDKDS
jgi:hypothetical protein